MLKVKNGRAVRRLAIRSLLSNRARNLIAAAAIALTTLLFTSLFTIAMSINEGFQQSNFRQAGGFSHGGFKYLSEEQFEQLKDDPLIQEWGLRRFLGMPSEAPFNKSHVEIGYSDENQAHWTYCDPVEGRLPEEGTDEAATDTKVLQLLGVEPELGAPFTVTFLVDGHETIQTFTLCGWWEYDEAIVANHILIPESRVDEVLKEVGVTPPGNDGMTGSWNLDIMLDSSLHIEQDIEQILQNHGYQSTSYGEGNYISIGVNWGYSGAQLSDNLEPVTIFAIAATLLLIIFTGYLIIYNVFQISVVNDIRFYGLLKTIGTTPRQLRSIVRMQALSLSVAGIPVGLLLGWLAGGLLTPMVISTLNGVVSVVSVDPGIFAAASVFSLVTVLISCRRPGRMAGRVSPIEALRYTEGASSRKKSGRRKNRVSVVSMAWANLGRSKGKTAVTMLSLSLAVVLMMVTVTLANGFDMDKYLSQMACDFQIADASYFQTGSLFSADTALPSSAVDELLAQGVVSEGGKTYGKSFSAQEFITEEYFRQLYSRWNTAEQLDSALHFKEKNEQGLVAEEVQLYGMEPYVLDHLNVLEGDLSAVYQPGSRAIAAVYSEDDYGNIVMDSHWARLGDKVTVRYVEEYEFCNPDTGEPYDAAADLTQLPYVTKAVRYRDIEYTVAALVTTPSSLDYRYYGRDEFILNDQTFLQDSGTQDLLYYAFDAQDGADAQVEALLKDYTTNINAQLDYESKATYAAEFEGFRNMFLMMGGALSFIVALVGVLNFFNAILTGIAVRQREFAMLQSIGMTGRQLKTMLVTEGLLYTLGSALLSALLMQVLSPLAGQALQQVFWFFSYRSTIWPLAVIFPLFALLGVVLPMLSYRSTSRRTIVERLRTE